MKTHSQKLPAWVQVAGVIILIAAFPFRIMSTLQLKIQEFS